ncbi:major facilitator superfamily protein [Escherichia coli]|uniref:Major facilitator superfamily protein n=1 Tax=Escherichia coli TaxID=562 RepID=A0A2X1J561_ECOLX|nr:major facilitator superfamily protein [Escherichia coli]
MSDKKKRSMAGLPWIAAMAFFMQALDATILNTALPAIAHSLNRSPLAMQSAIISYTLTVAMLIPVSGWLADRFGTRRIFTLAVSLFTLGSLACALSNSLPQLVVFRVIQGIGGAMMMPVARLALLRAYPRNELLPVLNFVAMPGLVGPILGPVLGGVLVTWATWHWIFLINIPIGIAGLLYARKHMPNFTTARRRFDITGFLLFGLSLVLFSSGIELFGEKIVASWIALTVIVTSIGLLLLYILHARRTPNPLISLDLFKTRTFSIGIVGNIATRLGDRLCTVPYAIDVTGRIWLSGVYCWLYDGTDSVRFHYCKIDGYPSLTSSGLSPYVSGDHGDYWANDRSVLFAITSNGYMDADLAVVYIRDGYVDAVYRDEYHHTCRSDR